MRIITDHDFLTGRSHTIRSFRWGVADEFDQDNAVLRIDAEPQQLDDITPGQGADKLARSRLVVKILIQRDMGTTKVRVSSRESISRN